MDTSTLPASHCPVGGAKHGRQGQFRPLVVTQRKPAQGIVARMGCRRQDGRAGVEAGLGDGFRPAEKAEVDLRSFHAHWIYQVQRLGKRGRFKLMKNWD
jgi:hypothetical protein